MKKIGFCINSLEMGGAEKLLVDIINTLSETKEYEIFLLTKEKSNSYFYNKIKDKVKYFYLLEKEEKSSFFSNLKNSILKKIKFRKFAGNVNIIIDFLDCDFYKYIKKVKNKKRIAWLHLSYRELQKRKKIEKKIYYYDKVIVIADDMEKEIKSETENLNIHKIYNLLDFSMIDKKLEENREKLPKEKYFLTVCRLNEEQKDVTTLINVFSLYKGNDKLLIIGDGEDRKKLEKLCKEKKLENKIKFLGTLSNPYIFMKCAECFILSSKTEGFGLVIAEALYCGTKVISSNCPVGPREILLDGKIGELFKVGDEKELLDKLNNISQKEYDKNLIEQSLKRYSKEEFIKKFKEVIEC